MLTLSTKRILFARISSELNTAGASNAATVSASFYSLLTNSTIFIGGGGLANYGSCTCEIARVRVYLDLDWAEIVANAAFREKESNAYFFFFLFTQIYFFLFRIRLCAQLKC